jgi:hypothetical protein
MFDLDTNAGGAVSSFPAQPVQRVGSLQIAADARLPASNSNATTPPTRSEAALWRTACHEAGHVVCERLLDIEIAGTTVVEGPDYSGLTWGPESTRALRGKAAHDDAGNDAFDAVAVQVAKNISRYMPGPGESRDDVADIFSSVQARVIGLMGGGAAEMAILGDSPPRFIESDVYSANAIAGIICQTEASRSAFIEHCYQEALAIIGEYKSVVLALAQALIDHPERTLNSKEIDEVIAAELAARGAADERQRRAAWKRVQETAAQLASRAARRQSG